MGRPCGEQRAALLSALACGPGTSRELARRALAAVDPASLALIACLSDSRAVTLTLDNMVRRGVPQARIERYERVPGRNRPVPVYGRLNAQPAAPAAGGIAATFAQLGLALFGGASAEVPA